jgi:hypothetical protein
VYPSPVSFLTCLSINAKRSPEMMHDGVRELIRGVALAFGLLIVTTIIVVIASFIVSALF